MSQDFESFSQFWPHYVRQHQSAGCRALHFVGSTLAFGCIVAAIALGNAMWLLAAPAFGYGISWIGHFVVERNRPAAFRHPVWSFLADLKMWGLMLTGRMKREVELAVSET
jgi:hypothetical protein